MMADHRLLKLLSFFVVVSVFSLLNVGLVSAAGPDNPPTFQEAEVLFIQALAIFWAFFVLDTLRFILYYGGKYVFAWTGAVDSNTTLMQDIRDKSTRIIISVIGVLGMPYFISLFMSILFMGSGPSACYTFLQNSSNVFVPVFQLVVPGC